MKTVRDILDNHFGTNPEDIVKKEVILRAISELLIECKPEWKTLPLVNGECPENAQDFILAIGYNECIYDYEKNIKSIIGGK